MPVLDKNKIAILKEIKEIKDEIKKMEQMVIDSVKANIERCYASGDLEKAKEYEDILSCLEQIISSNGSIGPNIPN